jgi:hypothetical protein
MRCISESNLSHLYKLQSIVRLAAVKQHHRRVAQRVGSLIAVACLGGKVDGLREVMVRLCWG